MRNTVLILLIATLCMVFAGSLYAGNPAEGPSITILDSLSDKFEPVRFDHAKHIGLAGNCGTCHHQHSNFSTLPCKECHSLSPDVFKKSVVNSFMACKNCHSSYDASNPKMPGLKTAYHEQCFGCHKGMGEVGEGPAGCTNMCHGKKGTNSKES
jgi:predicted CXXCH cytochrome family protein